MKTRPAMRPSPTGTSPSFSRPRPKRFQRCEKPANRQVGRAVPSEPRARHANEWRQNRETRVSVAVHSLVLAHGSLGQLALPTLSGWGLSSTCLHAPSMPTKPTVIQSEAKGLCAPDTAEIPRFARNDTGGAGSLMTECSRYPQGLIPRAKCCPVCSAPARAPRQAGEARPTSTSRYWQLV
mgnify:CR=1 FL=1